MASVTIRLEDATKIGFERFCNEVGLSVSSVFNMFAKKVAREQKLPFKVKVDPFYSEENMAFLRESIKQLEEGNSVKMTDDELKSYISEGLK